MYRVTDQRENADNNGCQSISPGCLRGKTIERQLRNSMSRGSFKLAGTDRQLQKTDCGLSIPETLHCRMIISKASKGPGSHKQQFGSSPVWLAAQAPVDP